EGHGLVSKTNSDLQRRHRGRSPRNMGTSDFFHVPACPRHHRNSEVYLAAHAKCARLRRLNWPRSSSVVVTARGQEGLTKVERTVAAKGGRVSGIQADAAKLDDAQRSSTSQSTISAASIFLFNNAAVFPPRLSIEMTEQIWDRMA